MAARVRETSKKAWYSMPRSWLMTILLRFWHKVIQTPMIYTEKPKMRIFRDGISIEARASMMVLAPPRRTARRTMSGGMANRMNN